VSVSPKTADGGSVQVSPQILPAFKAVFRGPVLGPAAPEYDQTRRIWDAMIDRRAGLVLRSTGTADVLHAARCACRHRCLPSPRGGGRDIAGWPSARAA
jgi:hypothetical protein